MTSDPLILVTGATGKTGRRIVERLRVRNLPVRLGSRSAEPAFDWDNAATWDAALEGVSAVYVSYQPDLAVPRAEAVIRAFTALAVEKGVRRIVLLSGRGEEAAQVCEQIVQALPIDWTILQASWFNQNFSESFFLEPLLSGEIALPSGRMPEPFIDADDIADVAVAALTEPQHAGQVYALTGPRLLTLEQAVSEIASVLKRDIRFMHIAAEDYVGAMRDAGLPDEMVWLVDYLFTTVLDGRNAFVTHDVRRALGREPRDFLDYARMTAASGVWSVAEPERG